MCFSATVSFVSAGALGIIGLVAVRKSRDHSQIPFALIPVLFSLQQFFEGLLRVALGEPSSPGLDSISTYIFLVAALVVWPIWVPLSILFLERIKARRDIVTGLLVCGVALGSYQLYCLVQFDVRAELVDGQIRYVLLFPSVFYQLTSAVYVSVIILPLFFSSVKWLSLLGLLIVMSFAVAALLNVNHLVSVWCCFAAGTSVSVLFIIAEMNKSLPAMVVIYRKPNMRSSFL